MGLFLIPIDIRQVLFGVNVLEESGKAKQVNMQSI